MQNMHKVQLKLDSGNDGISKISFRSKLFLHSARKFHIHLVSSWDTHERGKYLFYAQYIYVHFCMYCTCTMCTFQTNTPHCHILNFANLPKPNIMKPALIKRFSSRCIDSIWFDEFRVCGGEREGERMSNRLFIYMQNAFLGV